MKKLILSIAVVLLALVAALVVTEAYWSWRREQVRNDLCRQLRERAQAEWLGGWLSGKVIFSDSDWAAVAHHPSAHSLFDPIGDIAVVLKSDGEMLVHHYHYCGLEGLSSFLRESYSNWDHFVESHIDCAPWTKISERFEQGNELDLEKAALRPTSSE